MRRERFYSKIIPAAAAAAAAAAACAVEAVATVVAAAAATTPLPATPAAAAALAPAMKERRVTFGISLLCAVFPAAYAEGTEAVFPHEEREMLSRELGENK